jgi:hypothetical protein
VAIGDAAVEEGKTGTRTVSLTISLSAGSRAPRGALRDEQRPFGRYRDDLQRRLIAPVVVQIAQRVSVSQGHLRR